MKAGHSELNPNDDAVHANASWWSDNASDYLNEHGSVLGEADFIWGPEGLTEDDVDFLRLPTLSADIRILEVGAGAAQCSRALAKRGFDVVATDLAPAMVQHAQALNEAHGLSFDVAIADAHNVPFKNSQFDVVFTSFGVLPFVPDLTAIHREIFRVLKPGGVWAFSTTHPVRWMFFDDPTRGGMSVEYSYFDRTPYSERDDANILTYAEFHHTLADHVNSLSEAGFIIDEVFEPQWPAGRDVVWGGWGPERSPYVPGTLMIRSIKPAVPF